MKHMLKATSCLAVLVLALVSLWAAVNPVTAYAASASARCSAGGSVSCSGVSCQAQDSSSGATGYCFCTRSDGTNDVKYCNRTPVLSVDGIY